MLSPGDTLSDKEGNWGVLRIQVTAEALIVNQIPSERGSNGKEGAQA